MLHIHIKHKNRWRLHILIHSWVRIPSITSNTCMQKKKTDD